MKKAAPRRNRAARIRFSTGLAKAETKKTFDPTDDDWRRVESAYSTASTTLAASERSQIKECVDAYLSWAPFEETALKANDVKRTVERIAKATANLSRQLHGLFEAGKSEGNSGASVQDVAEAARQMIERTPTSPGVGSVLSQAGELLDAKNVKAAAEVLMDARRSSRSRGVKIEDQLTHLNELAFACEAAVEHLDATIRDRQGFDIGDAWTQMIHDLHAWARKSGKPHTVAKNRERSEPTPFIRFVAALQDCFPDGYARHTHSEWSLADAIHEVVHRREGLASSRRKDNP